MFDNRLTRYLKEHRVPYEALVHRRDVTAQETAADTHTPGDAFAKTVVLDTGEGLAFAVLPATLRLNLAKARRALDAPATRLADEDRMRELCPDCDVGAEPPFGNLYDVPVYVDEHLAKNNDLTFNAGTHRDAIRMRYADFRDLVHPKVADLASAS